MASVNKDDLDNIKTIQIDISGDVQIGKSAILQSIKKLLENYNYCVAIPNSSERLNPSSSLESAAFHEKPNVSKTVIILTENGI